MKKEIKKPRTYQGTDKTAVVWINKKLGKPIYGIACDFLIEGGMKGIPSAWRYGGWCNFPKLIVVENQCWIKEMLMKLKNNSNTDFIEFSEEVFREIKELDTNKHLGQLIF